MVISIINDYGISSVKLKRDSPIATATRTIARPANKSLPCCQIEEKISRVRLRHIFKFHLALELGYFFTQFTYCPLLFLNHLGQHRNNVHGTHLFPLPGGHTRSGASSEINPRCLRGTIGNTISAQPIFTTKPYTSRKLIALPDTRQ